MTWQFSGRSRILTSATWAAPLEVEVLPPRAAVRARGRWMMLSRCGASVWRPALPPPEDGAVFGA
eukprot:13632592-Alexandrium_andersonii.AAC.1